MSVDHLESLFDASVKVSVSCGLTLRAEVDALSPLHPDEIPAGFDSWAEKRRREFRCGRHHARKALRAASAPLDSILRDDDGVPLFPSGYAGSITHTGKDSTFAAAAITIGQCAVGIDAEVLSDLPDDMVAHVLSGHERDELRRVAVGENPRFSTEGRRALLAFSAKEAFYKCVFPRLRCRLGFHDAEFRVLQSETIESPGRFEISMRKPEIEAAPALLSGAFRSSDEHVVCAVSWLPNAVRG